jgi:hypothetical protein
MVLCRSERPQRFGGVNRLHLQFRRISQARKQHNLAYFSILQLKRYVPPKRWAFYEIQDVTAEKYNKVINK